MIKAKRAPCNLSKEAQRLWRKFLFEYEIADQGGLVILQTGLEAFDRMRSAQEKIKDSGETVQDRFGQIKAHPLCAVERDARSQMLQALKMLNLDLEPLESKPGRPAGR